MSNGINHTIETHTKRFSLSNRDRSRKMGNGVANFTLKISLIKQIIIQVLAYHHHPPSSFRKNCAIIKKLSFHNLIKGEER